MKTYFEKPRFTDSTKWEDDWFLELDDKAKLMWLYILDNCDASGLIKLNKAMVAIINIKCQTDLSIDDIEAKLTDKIFCVGDGLYYIPEFVKTQYTSLSGKAIKNRMESSADDKVLIKPRATLLQTGAIVENPGGEYPYRLLATSELRELADRVKGGRN